MMTRQEMDTLVGQTLIIREFPHICLAAGDDALLLLQIAVKDESFLKKGDPIKTLGKKSKNCLGISWRLLGHRLVFRQNRQRGSRHSRGAYPRQ